MKIITKGEETRRKLATGVRAIADVVRHTLGPTGGHTVLGFEYESPRVLDDGAMIAREVVLDDPTENCGAQLARMVSERTNRVAGDGTTTSLVLADAMVQELMKEDAGLENRRTILDRAALTVSEVEKRLIALASPVVGKEDVRRVAKISSGDDGIADMLADASEQLGKNASIVVRESKKSGVSLVVNKGMKIPNGSQPHFLGPTLSLSIPDCPVLIVDGPLDNKAFVVPFLPSAQERGAMLIIADSFSESVLDALVLTRQRGMNIVPVQAPHYAERRSEFLKDLALFSGAVVGEKVGSVGTADISMFETILTNGNGDEKEIQARVAELRELESAATSEHDAARIRDRIAALTSGVGVIHVGMNSEAEQKSVVAKIEDAINAVKSAQDGGIVPGGGVALKEASNLPQVGEKEMNGTDVPFGGSDASWVKFGPSRAIVNACSAPFRQICANMGTKEDSVSRYGDDVVDPLKVELNALRNAWSVARMVFLCEAGVAWKKDEPAAMLA